MAALHATTLHRCIDWPAADGAGAGAVLGALAGEAAEVLDAATVPVMFDVLLVLTMTPAGTGSDTTQTRINAPHLGAGLRTSVSAKRHTHQVRCMGRIRQLPHQP